jgi:hypothetical protein
MQNVYIIADKVSNADIEDIKKVLSFIGISESFIKVLDVSATDIDISDKKLFICFNSLFGVIARKFIEAKIYKAKDLLNGAIVDRDRGVLLYGLTGCIKEYASSIAVNDDKMQLWELLQDFKKNLESFSAPQEPKKEPEIHDNGSFELVEDPLEKELGSKKQDEVITNSEELVSINVEDLLNKVLEEIKLSDPGLGKSLKLTNRISLTNSDGKVLNIYPGNVIDDKIPGAHLSYKDMCNIVKMALIYGSDKIDFWIKD